VVVDCERVMQRRGARRRRGDGSGGSVRGSVGGSPRMAVRRDTVRRTLQVEGSAEQRAWRDI
jgi:hypothetical protein